VAGFGKIIPKEIIDLFPKGILNVHPSLLPKYRGPNPIRETILQGDEETGVTIFLIDELVDHGPIIGVESIFLKGDENYLKLEEVLGKLGGQKLALIINDYLEGKLTPIPQDDSKASYTRKVSLEDGRLDPNEGFEIWSKKIRALNPEPGTYLKIILREEEKMLKVFKIEKINENELPEEIKRKKTGEFFRFKNELGLRIKDAYLVLKEIQLEGRKKMSSKEFLNGYPLESFKLKN